MVTRQRVLVFRGGIFTVEPSLVPLFGVTVQLCMREFNLFLFLNRNATKFSVGSVYKFRVPVQMKKIPEEFNTRFLLKVYFIEDLKIADI